MYRVSSALYMVGVLVTGAVAATTWQYPQAPEGWQVMGCWTDIPSQRTLGGAYYVDPVYNDWQTCTDFCNDRLYEYAGVEYGRECYCGNEIRAGATQRPQSECSIPCVGDADGQEKCGGIARVEIFKITDEWKKKAEAKV